MLRHFHTSPLLLLLVAGGLLAGCQRGEQQVKTELTRVTASKPVARDIQNWETFTGQVKAKESVQVKAQVTGYVTAVKFKEGAEVEAGQVLFEIDPSTYAAIVKQAKGQLLLRKTEKDNAIKEFVRAEKLHKDGGISQQEYDMIVANKGKTEAAVLAAEGDYDRAETNLKYCTIKAEIPGQVGKALVTKGNLITEAGTTVMTTIVEMNPIYVEFGVDERELLYYKESKIKHGKAKPQSAADLKVPVELKLSVENAFERTGYVDFVNNQVDPRTGTILVRARFENADGKLVPGLYAEVRVATSDPFPALLVADSALLNQQTQKYVLVAVKEDGDKYRVKQKYVEIGDLTADGLRVIKAGLTADDLVIVNGVQFARPESLVEAKVEDMPTLPGAKSK